MSDSRSSRDASAAGAPIGARHDDSSLFSLDALKKTEEAASKKSRDDSGLIDLKALAAIAKEQRPKDEMSVASVVAPPDLFQLSPPIVPIAAPPIAVGAAIAPEDWAPRPPKTKLYVALGGGVAVVAAVLAFVLTHGSGDAAAVAGTPTAAAPTPPSVTATVAAAPPDEPKAAAVTPGARPAAPEPVAPPVATVAPKAASAPAAPRAAGPLPKAAAKDPAAPPPPPKEACDLACQMQRAVSGKK
jgi:hypothetical protein